MVIESDWNEDERREYERYSVQFYLLVYQRDSDSKLGHIVDISLGGLRMLGEKPIIVGQHFPLWMDVSLESGKKDKIKFDAWSVWCNEDLNPGFYEAGFRFMDLSPEAVLSIENIIAELSV